MKESNIPVYVINCKKDINRREYIIDLMKKYNIDFEFVTGVVPNKQEMQYMVDKKKCLHVSHRLLTQGEVGVAMSHLKIYQKMIDNAIDKAIIFEDDIYIKKNFLHVVEELEKVAPHNWQLILLGYGGKLGDQRICHKLIAKHSHAASFFSVIKPLNIVHGAFGYMLTLQGAEKFLKAINSSNPLYQAIDGYTGSFHFSNLYCIKPPCVFVKPEFSSTINEERDAYRAKNSKLLLRIKFMNKFTLWVAHYLHIIIFPVKCFRLKITYAIKNKDNFS